MMNDLSAVGGMHQVSFVEGGAAGGGVLGAAGDLGPFEGGLKQTSIANTASDAKSTLQDIRDLLYGKNDYSPATLGKINYFRTVLQDSNNPLGLQQAPEVVSLKDIGALRNNVDAANIKPYLVSLNALLNKVAGTPPTGQEALQAVKDSHEMKGFQNAAQSFYNAVNAGEALGIREGRKITWLKLGTALQNSQVYKDATSALGIAKQNGLTGLATDLSNATDLVPQLPRLSTQQIIDGTNSGTLSKDDVKLALTVNTEALKQLSEKLIGSSEGKQWLEFRNIEARRNNAYRLKDVMYERYFSNGGLDSSWENYCQADKNYNSLNNSMNNLQGPFNAILPAFQKSPEYVALSSILQGTGQTVEDYLIKKYVVV